MMAHIRHITLLLFLFGMASGAIAQQQVGSQDFVIGTQLLRQGEYQKAAEIFEVLVQQNPTNYGYLDSYVLALNYLKQTDKAIEAVSAYLSRNPNDVMTTIKLGELYHTSGDTTQAETSWNKAISLESNNPNVYRMVAESMQQRRDFDRAAAVLSGARTHFADPDLFMFELGNLYLVAGRFENAAREYNQILLKHPDRLQFVQRQYSRYIDQELADAAIIESDESLRTLSPGDERIAILRDFQIWLLLERGLYRRAIAVARGMDAATAGPQAMALFNVAQRLATQHEYELSVQALSVYADNPEHPMSARSAEERASMYMRWARWLITGNLDTGEKIHTLYQAADSSLKVLQQTHPSYQRRANVSVMQAEIALDHLKNIDMARSYLQQLERYAEVAELQTEQNYLNGRLRLFEGQFNEARIHFTRANTAARIGDMAEKTRYFLALTDFFGTDYEFAGIQLKALERQNASLYANDALQLRLWIMEGKNQDSTSTQIDLFSKAQFAFHTNTYDEAALLASELAIDHADHPLADDAVLLLSQVLRYDDPVDALLLTHRYITENEKNATEKILWERIQLAIRLKNDPERLAQELAEPRNRILRNPADSELAGDTSDAADQDVDLEELISNPGIERMLEDLLVGFSQGFYSNAARDLLRSYRTTP